MRTIQTRGLTKISTLEKRRFESSRHPCITMYALTKPRTATPTKFKPRRHHPLSPSLPQPSMALLRGLPTKPGRNSNEGNDTWRSLRHVGHLVRRRRSDWMPRARIILENGEARALSLATASRKQESPKDKSLRARLDGVPPPKRKPSRATGPTPPTSDLSRGEDIQLWEQ